MVCLLSNRIGLTRLTDSPHLVETRALISICRFLLSNCPQQPVLKARKRNYAGVCTEGASLTCKIEVTAKTRISHRMLRTCLPSNVSSNSVTLATAFLSSFSAIATVMNGAAAPSYNLKQIQYGGQTTCDALVQQNLKVFLERN